MEKRRLECTTCIVGCQREEVCICKHDMLLWLRKAVKGKRGCRFGCFHVEMILGKEDKPKVLCRKGWPRVAKAGFSRLQYETVDLKEVEEFKNENPHVFQARRDHPFEGMSNPVAQAVMRCNVDVKYIGRNFSEADLLKFCDGSIDQEPGVEVPASASSLLELSGSGLQEMELQRPALGSSSDAISGADASHAEQPVSTELDASDPPPKKQCMGRVLDTEHKKMQTMRKALERILVDLARDMMNVGFYTGEYAAKKFEISRSMLPELYAGLLASGRSKRKMLTIFFLTDFVLQYFVQMSLVK